MSDPITVAIVDDDPIVQNSLMSMLHVAPGIRPVTVLHDGAEAVAFASGQHVDVFLVDLQMPHLNGYTATEELVSVSPSSAVIILTSMPTSNSQEALTDLGAAAYLRKTATPATIVSTIRAVHEGTYDPTRPIVADPFLAPDFTERETEVLSLLGHGLSNREISDTLVLSESAVKKHITTIMTKLDATSRLDAAIKGIECGVISLSVLKDRHIPTITEDS